MGCREGAGVFKLNPELVLNTGESGVRLNEWKLVMSTDSMFVDSKPSVIGNWRP